MTACEESHGAVATTSRQVNEDTRQVTRTCRCCGTVLGVSLVEVDQWST